MKKMKNRIKYLFQIIFSHQGFQKYSKNTIWMLSDKVIKLLFGVSVGIWVIRYLGPEKFGILSYVSAFVALFTPLRKLGLDRIISRDIAKNETDINELLSTTTVMKSISSIIILSVVSVYMYLFKSNILYFYLSFILTFMFLTKSFETIEFYYRAKVKGKYITISNSIGIIFSAVLKIIFIYMELSLLYFGIAVFFETFLSIIVLLIFFRKEKNIIHLNNTNNKKALLLLKESWPLIFASFFGIVYLQIDKVMIEEMLGSYQVGQYSAAVVISSAFYFIPMTVGWSIQTAVVNAKKQKSKIYYEKLQLLFTIMVVIAYIILIPVSFLSNFIVNILYGKEYFLTGGVLKVHIFALLFIFLGISRGLWVSNEKYFKFAMFSNISAGILNIILNYFFLPRFGIIGAAYATLISYFFSYIGSCLFFPPAQKILIMQLRSIFLIDLVNQYKRLNLRNNNEK